MCFSSTITSTLTNTIHNTNNDNDNNNDDDTLTSINVSSFCHERHSFSHQLPATRALKKTTFILNLH